VSFATLAYGNGVWLQSTNSYDNGGFKLLRHCAFEAISQIAVAARCTLVECQGGLSMGEGSFIEIPKS
jgi:hypothetical protein